MLRFGIPIIAAATAFLPMPAAAVIYDFHSTEESALSPSPVNFDFALDTTTASPSGGTTVFGNVTINRDGSPVIGNTVGASFTTNIGSPLFFFLDTDTRPFYSGTGTGIRFDTGSFRIADGATDGIGTLSITEKSIAAVPEPSTWVSLLAGFALVGTKFRRLRGRTASVSSI